MRLSRPVTGAERSTTKRWPLPIGSAPSAIRAMLHSTDPWVVACAMAAAAELKLSELAAEMGQLAQRSAGDIGVVARAANAALK